MIPFNLTQIPSGEGAIGPAGGRQPPVCPQRPIA